MVCELDPPRLKGFLIFMAYVYRHIRLDKNEPFYIGIGSDENGKHIRAKNKSTRSSYWKKIVGKTDYRIEILFDDLTWEEAQEKEIEFIKLYGRLNNGTGILVNLTDGGGGCVGYKHTQDWLNKLSVIRKNFRYSEESKRKISESRTGFKVTGIELERLKERMAKNSGENHFMYGKKHSEETKRKISEARKGKKIEKITGGNSCKAKIVLDLSTGIFYDCGKDAAFCLDIKYHYFKKMMRRDLSKRKFPLIYA